MSFAHAGKSALRAAKNITHGYSDTESKARAATSNESMPPSGQQMHELSVLSYNQQDFVEMMEILDKRLNDKGKYWRHVYKSLVVVDYLLHSGSPAVISYFRSNIYIIKTLTEFQYVDDTGRDVGGNIRARARDITRLLNDETRLASERQNRQQMHDRMLGRSSHETSGERLESREARRGDGADDEDLQRALEASQRNEQGMTNEERDLARALQLSREEEEERKRKEMEKSTQDALFDDNQQINLVDTSVPAAPYVQPQFTQLQPQYTQFQPQYPQYSLQPQFTQLQPQYTMQPQYTAYNPYAQQQQYDVMTQQQQYHMSMQASQPQQLVPQATAYKSNNPFAHPSSVLSSPSPTSFSNTTPTSTPALTYRASTASSDASSRPPATPDASVNSVRSENARLAQLFAGRTGNEDGVDTFGNTGVLRYSDRTYGQLSAQKTGQIRASPSLSPSLFP